MALYVDEDKVLNQNTAGILIDAKNGCKNGFCMGISYRTSTEYGTTDAHEDQEGFYVLAGIGMALIGGEEFLLKPGTSFIVPDGVPHSMKKKQGSVPLKLLYTHGAI